MWPFEFLVFPAKPRGTRYAHAHAMVIMPPQILLVINTCAITDTKLIMQPASGPKANAPITAGTNDGSYFRNGAAGNSGISINERTVLMAAINAMVTSCCVFQRAGSVPCEVCIVSPFALRFLVDLSFVMQKKPAGIYLRALEISRECATTDICLFHPDYTVGFGFSPNLLCVVVQATLHTARGLQI